VFLLFSVRYFTYWCCAVTIMYIYLFTCALLTSVIEIKQWRIQGERFLLSKEHQNAEGATGRDTLRKFFNVSLEMVS